MKKSVGILAYGSLLDDPGDEIKKAIVRTIHDVTTPFKVEFARSSDGRKGAPTLVPVTEGGAQVRAKIYVLNVPEVEAANRLYRREIGKVGSGETYQHKQNPGPNDVVVERLGNFHELDAVLYTSIGANIKPLNPKKLAELAIESARKLDDGRDGITYLMDARKNGIQTPLSDAYEEEIKGLTESESLTEALENICREENKSKSG